jgi:hypothetical protein
MWQIFLEKLSEPGLLQSISVHLLLLGGIYLIIKKAKAGLKIRSAFVVLALFLLMAELLLRLTGTFATYLEKKSGHYSSYYKYRPGEALHKRHPGETVTLSSPGEFSYNYTINSQGYNDIEWDTASTDSTFKILILGDSFTEGFGAPQDSSWVAQLRKMLAENAFSKNRKPVLLLNAGISAADPYTNLYALQHELYRLKPDLVVQVISNQDFDEDFLLRGGYERFTGEGHLSYQVRPKAEWLYAYSHVSRIFFHYVFGYHQYLQKEQTEWEKTLFRLKHLEALTKAYEQWAEENKTECLFLFMDTDAYQIANRQTFDWEAHPFSKSKYLSTHSIIPCMFDVSKRDSASFFDYWWKNDGHHNSRGYGIMAQCIYPEILQYIPHKDIDLRNPEDIPTNIPATGIK